MQAAVAEAMARQAIEARTAAYKKEKLAEEKVRAVMKRREIKQKKLLKGLQDQG